MLTRDNLFDNQQSTIIQNAFTLSIFYYLTRIMYTWDITELKPASHDANMVKQIFKVCKFHCFKLADNVVSHKNLALEIQFAHAFVFANLMILNLLTRKRQKTGLQK